MRLRERGLSQTAASGQTDAHGLSVDASRTMARLRRGPNASVSIDSRPQTEAATGQHRVICPKPVVCRTDAVFRRHNSGAVTSYRRVCASRALRSLSRDARADRSREPLQRRRARRIRRSPSGPSPFPAGLQCGWARGRQPA